ncbi:hypothetical protein G7046_g6753 [Stylonectria norvegica]|nr:hypothetical protein G7046_g6753 [Stylonectria norvegica]
MSLDLERHLTFLQRAQLLMRLLLSQYGAYHHNSVNIAIHIVCVPLILVSGFCMVCSSAPLLSNSATASYPDRSIQATYTGTLINTPPWLTVPYLDLNLGTIAAFLYASLYLLLEPFAGFILAAFCMASVALANYLRVQSSESTFVAALGLHVFCWIMQFIGHGVFEGRAPALLDNLVQALFLAPMFVWLELLFSLGYRPELQARVEKRVQIEIAKFRASQKNGKAQ